MKEDTTNNQTTFSSIAYVCSLFLIIGLFPHFKNEFYQSVYDFSYDIVAIVSFVFIYLWIGNRITLIGLVIFVIGWNIKLFVYQLTRIDIQIISYSNLYLLAMILRGTGGICVIIGISNMLKIKYWAERINLNSKVIFGLLIGFTLIFQLVFRII